jgi:hypothetical protein
MQQFGHRLRRIDSRHQKLARGFQVSVQKDGLIIARPARQVARFPWRGLLMILVAMLAFKGLLHAQIGAETYADRVTALSNGTIIEQAGAWFMAPDPVTLWLSTQFQGLTF